MASMFAFAGLEKQLTGLDLGLEIDLLEDGADFQAGGQCSRVYDGTPFGVDLPSVFFCFGPGALNGFDDLKNDFIKSVYIVIKQDNPVGVESITEGFLWGCFGLLSAMGSLPKTGHSI